MSTPQPSWQASYGKPTSTLSNYDKKLECGLFCPGDGNTWCLPLQFCTQHPFPKEMSCTKCQPQRLPGLPAMANPLLACRTKRKSQNVDVFAQVV